MEIRPFFDPRTSTLTYVVWDPATRDAVVIDPVLDYDPVRVRVFEDSLQALTAFIDGEGLRVRLVLETHAHADHLSGSQSLKRRYDAGVAIGEHIRDVQEVFGPVFGLGPSFPTDGSQFDRLFRDGEVFQAGSLSIQVIHTPGHTPACVTYCIGDALFTGDALFMPDSGTGRCDFPRGSADALYDSVAGRLYPFPDETRVFVGHDYQPGGRELRYETTIGASKEGNRQLPAGRSKEEFVRFRTERDRTLELPRLLFPSVQVNINAGRLPAVDEEGRRFLKLPLGAFG